MSLHHKIDAFVVHKKPRQKEIMVRIAITMNPDAKNDKADYLVILPKAGVARSDGAEYRTRIEAISGDIANIIKKEIEGREKFHVYGQ